MGTTSDPSDPRLGYGSDESPVRRTKVYLVLSDEERAQGFVRPFKRRTRTRRLHRDAERHDDDG